MFVTATESEVVIHTTAGLKGFRGGEAYPMTHDVLNRETLTEQQLLQS